MIYILLAMQRIYQTLKNEKRASCNKSVDILQHNYYQQANISMRLHGLTQLFDDKLIAKICNPQACYQSANDKLQQA